MSTVETLRYRQKQRINTIFNKVVSSSLYKQWQTKLGLANYKIMIATEEYKQQTIDMIAYAYSMLSKNNPLSIILQIPISSDCEFFAPRVNHLIKTGSLFIAVDPDNAVCGSTAWFDLCDVKWETVGHGPVTIDLLIKNLFEESCLVYCSNNAEFAKIYHGEVKQNELNLYYGKWCEGTLFAKGPSTKNSSILDLLLAVAGRVRREIGYTFSVSRSILINLYTNWNGCYFLRKQQKLKDVKEFEKYFDDLEFKYGYKKQYIDTLKEIQMCFAVWKYDQDIQKRNENAMTYFKQRVQKSLRRRRVQSKL